jgi:hypothetical protein
MPRYIIQHWRAPNDRNGNPRRAFIAFDTASGHTVGAWDEGYVGAAAVPRNVWDDTAVYIGAVDVTASTYRHMLRQHGAGC